MQPGSDFFDGLDISKPMQEAVGRALGELLLGTLVGFPQPRIPIAPLVDWIVNNSGLPRNQVDNFIRAHHNDMETYRAATGDMASRCVLIKRIALALGIHAFDEAYSVQEILDVARVNRERPVDEAACLEGKALIETVCYRKGHKNSKGESAPWVIVSCQNGKILSSHKSKEKAEEHLRQMEYYKHKG